MIEKSLTIQKHILDIRARRRSLRLDITTRAIGVERSFLLWAPGEF